MSVFIHRKSVRNDLLGLAFILSACGSAEPPPPYSPEARALGSVCGTAKAPPGCGQDCGPANPFCPEGLFCGAASKCDAQCVANDDASCPNGDVCTFNGRCSARVAGSQCATVQLDIKRVVPNVSLLIDQSGSMNATLYESASGLSNPTRWDLIRDFMIGSPSDRNTDEAGGLIFDLQRDVKFSIALYSADWYWTPDEVLRTDLCPAISWPIILNAPAKTPLLNNYALIRDFYASRSPWASTPTGPALIELARGLDSLQLEGPKIIILATDGEPDTCSADGVTLRGDSPELEAQKRAVARETAVAAAAAAYGDGTRPGIRTYVIGVGPDTSNTHLQDLANAGTGVSDSPYWKITLKNIPDARAELAAAFQKIIYPVVSCTLELSKPVARAQACNGEVKLNGSTEGLSCDAPDGWRLADDERHIELQGAACAELKRPLFDNDPKTFPEVEATFPCDAITTI